MVRVPCFSGREELVEFVVNSGFRILNLCHIPEDGRLRTLSFATSDRERVLEVLESGERVDGSSLFSSIEPGKSDIYVTPRVARVFVNPFASVPTLNVLCDYLDENGKPLGVAPRNVLVEAEKRLKNDTGLVLKGLAELEYYVMARQDSPVLFEGLPDRNYHDSAPFARFEALRNEALVILAEAGIDTKYAHGEVGRIIGKDGGLFEQHEIELAVQNLTDMADNVAIAKWVLRNLCANHNMSVTFVPKILPEHAGTGMHIHLCAMKDGKNITASSGGGLSDEAKTMIGGILRFARSLSAFGNPTPVSYLRFIARKESPMHICWATRNRLALIRIPLWRGFKRKTEGSQRETFEYRAPDAFANIYLLCAGLVLAAEYGLKNPDEALKIAEELHAEADKSLSRKLGTLPRSCWETADSLEKDRQFYEADEVFPKRLIDKTIEVLKAFKDADLWKELNNAPNRFEDVVREYLHYG